VSFTLRKTSSVRTNEITEQISVAFDYVFDGESVFDCVIPDIPDDYKIGLIVGSSGSGKSTILNTLGRHEDFLWPPNEAVVSSFKDADDAKNRLSGVGFNSVPSWMRPYSVLSTGEKFRADMAISIKDNACIDEFTSVVDRVVARSCACAINRYINAAGFKKVTFSSCHKDIIDWLQPCWIYDTDAMKLLDRGAARRPDITVNLYPCNTDVWPLFSRHHYLTGDLNKSSRCWVATWEGQAVGFTAIIAFPNGNFMNAWREHRTVVLPEYQGLGLGVRISDAVGKMVLLDGGRYFSKTAHYRMGEYRENSPLWVGTSKNKKYRKDYNYSGSTKEDKYKHLHAKRVCYSHEYMGVKQDDEDFA